jgi:hypothetical protein
MWGAPSEWTPVSKTCPGKGRIAQFHDVLVPWLAEMHKAAKDPTHVKAKAGEQWKALAARADVNPFDLYRANNPVTPVVPERSYLLP